MKFCFVFLMTAFSIFRKVSAGVEMYGPAPDEEVFQYGDSTFYLFMARTRFQEAILLCSSKPGGHLAVLNTPEKSKAVANFMAESWSKYANVWISGQRVLVAGVYNWLWLPGNEKIPDEPWLEVNVTAFYYPPWIYHEAPENDDQECLSLGRNGHDDPLFIDFDCSQKLPYLCELIDKKKHDDSQDETDVSIFGNLYSLYHLHKTWSESVRFCHEQGLELATVANIPTARSLALTMLKARPAYEAAWIGLHRNAGMWIWIETGEEVETRPAEYNDTQKGEQVGNVILPAYPPWFYETQKPDRDCVTLDRHLCEEPTFVDVDCSKKRSFVCQRRNTSGIKTDTIEIKRKNKRYVLYPTKVIWSDAYQVCQDQSVEATLLNLTDIDETTFIITAMRQLRHPLDHIWLGGRVKDDKWHWVGRTEEQVELIRTTVDVTGFPPWCDNETNIDRSCLNLDKQAHKVPLIYGIECNATQAFICVEPVELNDIVVNINNDTLRVQQKSINRTWSMASSSCKNEIGELWKPYFKQKPVINVFVKELRKSKQNYTVYFVDAGECYKDGIWLRGVETLNINTENKCHKGDRLTLVLHEDDWKWRAIHPKVALNGQAICKATCSMVEVPYEPINSEWICDAPTSVFYDHRMLGMSCKRVCRNGLGLKGPEDFSCSRHGWLNTQILAGVESSQCFNASVALKSISQMIKINKTEVSTLGVIIDLATGELVNYRTQLYVLGCIIEFYYHLDPGISLAVVAMKPVRHEDTDELGYAALALSLTKLPTVDEYIEHMKKLKNDRRAPRSYGDAIDILSQLVLTTLFARDKAKREESTACHTYILATGPNERSTIKYEARRFKEKHPVFVFSTNGDPPVREMLDLASMTETLGSLSYKFFTPPDLIRGITNFLKTSCPDSTAPEKLKFLIEDIMKKEEEMDKHHKKS